MEDEEAPSSGKRKDPEQEQVAEDAAEREETSQASKRARVVGEVEEGPGDAPAPAPASEEPVTEAPSLAPASAPGTEAETEAAPAPSPIEVPTVIASAPATVADNGTQLVTAEIPENKVGAIIGTRGGTISILQQQTGCRLKMNAAAFPGAPRFLEYSGTSGQIQAAQALVARVMAEGSQVLNQMAQSGGATVTMTIDLPPSKVGRVIGQGGNTIKEMQSRSGAAIKVDQQSMSEHEPRKVHLSGTQASVTAAMQLVNYVIEHGPGLPPLAAGGPMGHAMMPGGLQVVNHTLDCPKASLGRIIGRGGEMINQIQNTTGARVLIDQNVPEGAPCKVNISGSQHSVALAIQAALTAMQDGARGVANLAAATPLYGAVPMAAPYGQMGGQYGMPMQQPAYAQAAYPHAHQQHQQLQQHQQQYGAAGARPQGVAAYGGYPPAQAPPAPPPPSAAGQWTEYKDQSGASYYHNSLTGESTWTKPVGM